MFLQGGMEILSVPKPKVTKDFLFDGVYCVSGLPFPRLETR